MAGYSAVNSRAWVAQMATKWSTITIGTEQLAYFEIETHATLCKWSTLLAAWIAGVCTQQ